MREILFRGKTLTDEWVEGAYYKQEEFYGDKEESHVIITSKDTLDNDLGLWYSIVIPETVGQYTGLNDKNGKKVFEGDIIRYTRTNMFCPEASFHKKDLVSFHLVLWDSSVSAFVQQHYTFTEKRLVGKGSAVLYDSRAEENIVEVIGNIHDNPELLKELNK